MLAMLHSLLLLCQFSQGVLLARLGTIMNSGMGSLLLLG
jgi:hypothetical protein